MAQKLEKTGVFMGVIFHPVQGETHSPGHRLEAEAELIFYFHPRTFRTQLQLIKKVVAVFIGCFAGCFLQKWGRWTAGIFRESTVGVGVLVFFF